MRKLVIILGILALALAACNDEPPPTQIVLVVTATTAPGAETPEAATLPAATATTLPTQAPSVTPSPKPEKTKKPQATDTPAPTPQPELFPTNVAAQVQIVEEVYQHGRMFWLRHNREIWVMVNNPPDNSSGGDWYCYNDTWEEGEAEIDPSLVPPEGMYQPRRGFGLLWRTHTDLHDVLGWGTTPEFELTSNYTYIAGGYVQGNTYYPAAGEHRLTTLYGDSISFFESDVRGDCLGGTWRMTQ
jgi:hypothetical protein